MAKREPTAFFCKECGYESSKWMGQCPCLQGLEFHGGGTKMCPSGSQGGLGRLASGVRNPRFRQPTISLLSRD